MLLFLAGLVVGVVVTALVYHNNKAKADVVTEKLIAETEAKAAELKAKLEALTKK